MARPVTLLVVFFLSMNLFSGILISSGAAAGIGLDANVGGDEINQSVPREDFDTGSPTGSTLFGMYNVLTTQIENLFRTVYPGLAMMERAGVPDYILYGFLSPVFSLLIVIDIASFLRGWGL